MGTLAFLSQLLLLALGIFLMIVILLQRGRGGGLAGAFGGLGGQSAFGTKAGDVFTKITIVMAVLWVVVAGSSGLLLRDAAEVRAQGLGDVKKEDDSETTDDTEGGVSSGSDVIEEPADDEAMTPATDESPATTETPAADGTPAETPPADDAAATDDTGTTTAPPKPADTESPDAEAEADSPAVETPAAEGTDSTDPAPKSGAESTPEPNSETSDE